MAAKVVQGEVSDAKSTAPKLERIETRAAQADRERIVKAADALGESMAQFMLRSALKEADEILTREVDVTRMPVEQYEALIEALNQRPDVIPELARIADRPRRFTRR